MSLLGGALIVLLRAAGEQEGKGASSVSPATRPRGRHNFCGQQESTSPEGGFLVNLSQQMAPFSGGRITGESPPARLLHAGGRVGSVDAPPWSRAFGITSLTDMAVSIYRERSLRDPQHDGQRGGVAALQGERRLGRKNLSLRWIFRPSAGLLAGFSIHPDGKHALTSISKWPIGSGCWRGSSSGRRTGCAAAASLSETCAGRTSGRTTLRWKVRAGGVGVGAA